MFGNEFDRSDNQIECVSEMVNGECDEGHDILRIGKPFLDGGDGGLLDRSQNKPRKSRAKSHLDSIISNVRGKVLHCILGKILRFVFETLSLVDVCPGYGIDNDSRRHRTGNSQFMRSSDDVFPWPPVGSRLDGLLRREAILARRVQPDFTAHGIDAALCESLAEGIVNALRPTICHVLNKTQLHFGGKRVAYFRRLRGASAFHEIFAVNLGGEPYGRVGETIQQTVGLAARDASFACGEFGRQHKSPNLVRGF